MGIIQLKVHPGAIPDSYIVKLKPGAASAEAFTANYPGATVTSTYKSVFEGFAAQMSPEQAEEIANSEEVEYVETDGMVYADVDTWGLDRIDQRDLPVDNTYNPYADGSGVTAYILDTGIRITHEEFADGNRAEWGENFTGDGRDEDCNGHGTHVAGTVAGKEYGVAKKAKVVAVKVLGCSGSGSYAGVIAGMEWVMNNADKPATANMSLGGGKNQAADDAAKALHNSGVPNVVAAGNSNADACNATPAGADDVITVGSSASNDGRSSFSNWGGCVEIFAPGSNIKSAWWQQDNQYRTISGTSMAAPHVCGGAALLLGNGEDPANVSQKLQDMATPNKIGDPKGSPNLLLYVGGSGSPPTTRPPTTRPPTTRPPTTRPPTPPPGECKDSKAFMQWNGKWRKCKWLGRFKKPCENEEVKSFCPEACGACEEYGCSDATGTFRTKRKFDDLTCAIIAGFPDQKKARKCKLAKIKTTCRDTCKVC